MRCQWPHFLRIILKHDYDYVEPVSLAVKIEQSSHGDKMDFHARAYTLTNTYSTVQKDLANRNLYFRCADQIRSYHQSILAQNSKLLKKIFSERACCNCQSASCGSVDDVLLVLDEVEMNTLAMLMECVYTGQCLVRDREEVTKMIELKDMLGLDIKLDLGNEGDLEDPTRSPIPRIEGRGSDRHDVIEPGIGHKEQDDIVQNQEIVESIELSSDVNYYEPDQQIKAPDKVVEEEVISDDSSLLPLVAASDSK